MTTFCCGDTKFMDVLRLIENGESAKDIGTVIRCGKCLKPCGSLKLFRTANGMDDSKIIELLNKNRSSYFTRFDLGLPPKNKQKKSESRVVYPPRGEPEPEIEEPLDDEEALFG